MIYIVLVLLVVIAAGIGWIGFVVTSIAAQQHEALNEIIRLQARSEVTIREAKLEQLSSRVVDFLELVQAGYFPNLRRDDWYAKKSDIKRWEDRDNRMLYLDD